MQLLIWSGYFTIIRYYFISKQIRLYHFISFRPGRQASPLVYGGTSNHGSSRKSVVNFHSTTIIYFLARGSNCLAFHVCHSTTSAPNGQRVQQHKPAVEIIWFYGGPLQITITTTYMLREISKSGMKLMPQYHYRPINFITSSKNVLLRVWNLIILVEQIYHLDGKTNDSNS